MPETELSLSENTPKTSDSQFSRARKRQGIPRTALIVVGLLLAVSVTGVVLHSWSGGVLPAWMSLASLDARRLLAASGPQESVLRTFRLAGFESATVGSDRDGALVWLDVSGISSAADIEIAWQTAGATLAAAYPSAGRYVVVITVDAEEFAELAFENGADMRNAVVSDDARMLLEVASVRLLAPNEAAATQPPADALAMGEDLDVEFLDAKNRAAGLLGEGEAGPVADGAGELALAVEATRLAVPGIRAPGPDERAAELYAERIRTALAAHSLEGGESVLAWIDAVGLSPGREGVARMRTWASVVDALATTQPLGSVSEKTYSVAGQVLETGLAPGALSDAVLAAADSESAPAEAVEVTRFRREPRLDIDATLGGQWTASDALPIRVLGIYGSSGLPPSLTWISAGERVSVAPTTWIAYRRADGALYWLAGERGDVALTDASTRGWAFSRSRAALVDASRCGRTIASFPPE